MSWTRFVPAALLGAAIQVPGNSTPALAASDAFSTCMFLRDRDACVVGGDVYVWSGTKFRLAESWAMNRVLGQPWPDYREASIAKVARVIEEACENPEDEQPVFVLRCFAEAETEGL